MGPGEAHRIEQSQWRSDFEDLLDVYGVDDPAERGAYIELAEQSRLKGRWVGYQDVLGKGAYVGMETEAPPSAPSRTC